MDASAEDELQDDEADTSSARDDDSGADEADESPAPNPGAFKLVGIVGFALVLASMALPWWQGPDTSKPEVMEALAQASTPQEAANAEMWTFQGYAVFPGQMGAVICAACLLLMVISMEWSAFTAAMAGILAVLVFGWALIFQPPGTAAVGLGGYNAAAAAGHAWGVYVALAGAVLGTIGAFKTRTALMPTFEVRSRRGGSDDEKGGGRRKRRRR